MAKKLAAYEVRKRTEEQSKLIDMWAASITADAFSSTNEPKGAGPARLEFVEKIRLALQELLNAVGVDGRPAETLVACANSLSGIILASRHAGVCLDCIGTVATNYAQSLETSMEYYLHELGKGEGEYRH